jgi:hypothetical protein
VGFCGISRGDCRQLCAVYSGQRSDFEREMQIKPTLSHIGEKYSFTAEECANKPKSNVDGENFNTVNLRSRRRLRSKKLAFCECV